MENSNPNNGIGDISHSRIERIEQKIEYTTELSEEIKVAILSMTKLLKEDVEWKREERLEIRRSQLRRKREGYFQMLLFAFFLIPMMVIVINLLYISWKFMLVPFRTAFMENQLGFVQSFRTVALHIKAEETNIISSSSSALFIICGVFMFIFYIVAYLMAHQKYKKEFKKLGVENDKWTW